MLVSAGFDAHALDPLATCRVSERGYAEMTASLRRACAAVGAPLGLVLEGGYSLEALTDSVAALMPVLVGGVAAGGDGRGAVHPLADGGGGAAGAVVAGAAVRELARDDCGARRRRRRASSAARLGGAARVVLAREDDPVALAQRAEVVRVQDADLAAAGRARLLLGLGAGRRRGEDGGPAGLVGGPGGEVAARWLGAAGVGLGVGLGVGRRARSAA